MLTIHSVQMNWQVSPIPPWKCSFRPQNFIGTCILNVITDSALLAIPIPLLWQLRVPLKKKLVIALMLSSGLFVITAAIVRVVLSVDAIPSAPNINRWGVRETFIGLITVTMPVMRPLFSKPFWMSGRYNARSYQQSTPWSGTDMSTKRCPRGRNEALANRTIGGSRAYGHHDPEMGQGYPDCSMVMNRLSTSSGENILKNHVTVVSTVDVESELVSPPVEEVHIPAYRDRRI